MRRTLATILLVSPMCGLCSCGGGRPAAPAAGRADPGEPGGPARSFPLTGVVREVNRGAGIVAIRHDAVPGFMPAMTMPFDLKGQEVLEDLEPGDKVRGTLRVDGREARLEGVEITELATAPPGAEGPAGPKVLEVGEEVPDFAMTTQDGQALRLSDLRGKVVVVTFIYTRCPLPNFCPLMDRKFSELASWVRGVRGRDERVRLLSVSFDPEHDTPEVLRRHARLRGARPPVWTFAVAQHDELRKAAGSLGLAYAPTGPDEIIHGLSTAVIDAGGRLAALERGNSWEPAGLMRVIADLLRGGAEGGGKGG